MSGFASSRPPFRLEGIEHVLFLVSDMEEALAFYEGALGAVVESRLPRYAMAELRVGASHLDLVDTSAPEGAWAKPAVAGGRNVDHVAIRIDAANEAALRHHLAAGGVAIVEERIEETAEGNTLSLYVRDPSGNTLELISRPK
jgi:glyoxylase I family protein